MSYSQQHVYLTVHWGNASNAEVGQVGLRFGRTDLPDETHLDGLVTFMQTWWSAAASAIPSVFRMARLKLAIVQPDGKYPPTHVPFEHDYDPAIAGGGSSTAIQALQVAGVTTLGTSAIRGRASKGRIYLPPVAGTLVDFRFSNTQVGNRAAQCALLVGGLNDVFEAPALVMSRVGLGISREITQVRVGDLPDVQRRRARQLDDNYTTVAVV